MLKGFGHIHIQIVIVVTNFAQSAIAAVFLLLEGVQYKGSLVLRLGTYADVDNTNSLW